MHLLVIEDDISVRDTLLELIERGGHTAEAVDGVADAITALSQERHDLIVLDLVLPDGNGVAVLRHLRGRGSRVPVIVCSGHPDRALRSDMFDDGADAFLDKPFSGNELLARVNALLRPRQARAPRLTALRH